MMNVSMGSVNWQSKICWKIVQHLQNKEIYFCLHSIEMRKYLYGDIKFKFSWVSFSFHLLKLNCEGSQRSRSDDVITISYTAISCFIDHTLCYGFIYFILYVFLFWRMPGKEANLVATYDMNHNGAVDLIEVVGILLLCDKNDDGSCSRDEFEK